MNKTKVNLDESVLDEMLLSHLSSTVYYLNLPSTYHLPYTIKCALPITIYHLPSIVFNLPSTYHLPYTINCAIPIAIFHPPSIV